MLCQLWHKKLPSREAKTACNRFWWVQMTGRSWEAREALTEALRSFNPPIRERSELPNSHIPQNPPRPAKQVLPLADSPLCRSRTVEDKKYLQRWVVMPVQGVMPLGEPNSNDESQLGKPSQWRFRIWGQRPPNRLLGSPEPTHDHPR